MMSFLDLDKLSSKLDGFADDGHWCLAKVTKRLLEITGDEPKIEYSPGQISTPADPTPILQADLAAEAALCMALEQAIPICEQQLDDATRNVFKHNIKIHRCHQAWLEAQLRLIKALGDSAYYGEQL
jgi:bacterioferritin (cytochrome b1)